MAAITKTRVNAVGAVTIATTTLSASDTLTYDPNYRTMILLRNPTAGALAPTFDGAGGTTVGVAGAGALSIAAGLTIPSIAAGASAVIEVANVALYFQGVTTVTNGLGLVASVIEFT